MYIDTHMYYVRYTVTYMSQHMFYIYVVYLTQVVRLATALQPRAAGPGLHGDDPHGVAAAGGRSGNLGLYDISSDILYIYVL